MSNLSREEIIEDLKQTWRMLWQQRVDDKEKAEGIANDDYPRLFVDRGTVIFATRDFRPLSFREILEKHKMIDFVPSPEVGGWGTFIRTVISRLKTRKRVEETRKYLECKKRKQQLRKGGHGWLHV